MIAAEIDRRLAAQARAVCQHLLPNGRELKGEWLCGSVGGEAGKSLKVRIEGAKAGVWVDYSGSADDRGDLLELWKRTRGLGFRDTCEEAMEWLNIPEHERASTAPLRAAPIPTAAPEIREPSKTWLRLQSSLRKGTISELDSLARLRKLPSFAGLELATRAGQLWFADVWDDGFEWPAWIVTDGSRRNAQARRMDGQPWSGIGGAKAKTIAGSEAKWPLGIAEVRTLEVALVEGAPDFLTAWHLIWFMERTREISPVAMLGASQSIHPEALPLFANRRVWLFPHTDDNQAGAKAAATWTAQLESIGAMVLPFDLQGEKDLNDFVASATAELMEDAF